MNKKGFKLIFNENFKNLDNWNFEEGFVRNHEFQYYTKNNHVLNNGITMICKKEKVVNKNYKKDSNDWRCEDKFANYTSCSINTKDKFSFLYGHMEVKAKIPCEKGAWPAIWMLGAVEEYPYCDEIDVMEKYEIDGEPSILANFMCSFDGSYLWSTKYKSLELFQSIDKDWANKFHIWSVDWTKDYMNIYIDDILINSIDSKNIAGNKFKKPLYILLNLAIGQKGTKPNDEDLPLKYIIEYVKVWQKGDK